MATTPKPTTNGTANSNSAKPTLTVSSQQTQATATATSRNENREEPKQEKSNIEQRLEKFHQLEKLKERRDTIQDALDDLADFHIAPTGGANLQLQDSKRNTFAIAHPVVIGEMVTLAKKKLQEELDAIDAQFIL
jgi:hypothetical protein